MKTTLIVLILVVVIVIFGGIFAILWQQPVEESEVSDTDPIIAQYVELQNKSCSTDDDCHPLDCVEGMCLVKRCKQDSDCPAGLWCGQGLHLAPGMCSKSPGAL